MWGVVMIVLVREDGYFLTRLKLGVEIPIKIYSQLENLVQLFYKVQQILLYRLVITHVNYLILVVD